MSKYDEFIFHMPVELLKAKDEEPWKIKGIASTGDQDLQGEVIEQDGLDISLLKAGRGLFNYDHLKGPENILGQIEDANFAIRDGKKVLEVEGYLFKDQPRAQAIKHIMAGLKKGAAPRVQMSIEGKIIRRSHENGSIVKQARIDKVALTLDPVNPYTFAQLCKSLNQEDEVIENTQEELITIKKAELEQLIDLAQKALSAGAGSEKAPEARSGGETMTPESLDSKTKAVNEKEKKKKPTKTMVKSILDTVKQRFPDENPWEVTEIIIESLLELKGDQSE